jgi:ABC-type phosphate transport system permease subunit
MQSDSFSLDAQLRQIKEQAERDGAHSTVVKYFTKSLYLSFIQSGISFLLGIVIPVYLL